MTRNDNESRQTDTIAASSHEQNVGEITGKARQRVNLLAFTIVGIFVFILVILLLSGAYVYQKILAPAISIQATTIVDDVVDPESNNSIITETSDKDGMILVFVQAGEFIMGNDSGSTAEKPAHNVYVDSFWIDRTEVTNAMYSKCVSDGKCPRPDSTNSNTREKYYGNSEFDNYPVIFVSWNSANIYCEWANRRLPTEAEWEKAASWDEKNNRKITYPWGNRADCSLANYWAPEGGCVDDTTEVGSYESGKSPYGAYDMGGNVGEWVSSLYAPYPYKLIDGRERGSSSASDLRIVRGGAWYFPEDYMRVTYRSAPNHSLSNFSLGFRCAKDAE